MFAQSYLYFTTTIIIIIIYFSLFLFTTKYIIKIKINAYFVTILADIKHVEVCVSHKFDYFVVTKEN